MYLCKLQVSFLARYKYIFITHRAINSKSSLVRIVLITRQRAKKLHSIKDTFYDSALSQLNNALS